jgi:hypothetical protein
VAVVVVGGQSKNVGKTSLVASLIAAMPEMRWTAMKITQYKEGFCAANGEPCECLTANHSVAVSVERDVAAGTDSSRFLAAGAARSLWVRTRAGMLGEAMGRIRQELAGAGNAILESNSVLGFLEPDLYLSVLDAGTAEFKASARMFLERADAVVVHAAGEGLEPRWEGVSAGLMAGKPRFVVGPPDFASEELVRFVQSRLTSQKGSR